MLPKLVLVLMIAVVFVHAASARSARVARAPKPALENRSNDKPCETVDTPCGWAVYIDYTREVDYYVLNCNCKDDELCTKYEDDISSKAFVYKCLYNSNSTTTLLPPTTTQ